MIMHDFKKKQAQLTDLNWDGIDDDPIAAMKERKLLEKKKNIFQRTYKYLKVWWVMRQLKKSDPYIYEE